LCDVRGLALVEDCAQALGASFAGAPVGTVGDAAAFSFCQDKIMTTGGEGGMLVTRDADLWERCWSYKDHGKTVRALDAENSAPAPGFRWLHERFGTNWRMTEMQAAIGSTALSKVPGWVETRRAHAAALDDAFAAMPALRRPAPPAEAYHACYRHYAYVRPEALADGWDRERIAAAVMAEGVPCGVGSCPEIYLEEAFEGVRPAERLAVARELGETSLAFLVHPTLTGADVADTAEAVAKVMAVASR
ncbi:MAG: DegT/DnrJ/EryC1/StrS aminotransferase family protein, partial [Actinobacteria bacterium]